MPRPKNAAFTLTGKGIDLNDPPPPPMFDHPPIEGPEYPYYDYDLRTWVFDPDSETKQRENAWKDWVKEMEE